jgi:hypothetical protein
LLFLFFTLRTGASKALKIGLIPGDGIGRQVIPAAEKVLSSVSGIPKPTFIHLDAGFEHFQKHGVALPPETVRALKEECNGAMFGAVSSPSHKVAGYSSPIVQLRKELDLYANIRPVNSVPGTDGRQVEMTIVRENTECLVRDLLFYFLLFIFTLLICMAVRQARGNQRDEGRQGRRRKAADQRTRIAQDRNDGVRSRPR